MMGEDAFDYVVVRGEAESAEGRALRTCKPSRGGQSAGFACALVGGPGNAGGFEGSGSERRLEETDRLGPARRPTESFSDHRRPTRRRPNVRALSCEFDQARAHRPRLEFVSSSALLSGSCRRSNSGARLGAERSGAPSPVIGSQRLSGSRGLSSRGVLALRPSDLALLLVGIFLAGVGCSSWPRSSSSLAVIEFVDSSSLAVIEFVDGGDRVRRWR